MYLMPIVMAISYRRPPEGFCGSSALQLPFCRRPSTLLSTETRKQVTLNEYANETITSLERERNETG